MPGPGSYAGKATTANVNFKDAPKWGFGSSDRPAIQQKGKGPVPGPGTYRLKSTFADVPSYLLPNQQHNFV